MNPADGDLLRTRVMVAHALCAIADSELHAHKMRKALKTIIAIRRIINEVNLAVVSPARLSANTARELEQLSWDLEHRVRNIETTVRLLSPS